MNEMTDNNIDSLIRETFERSEWIRRWARVSVFSFGLPMVLLVFAACMYLYIARYGTSTFTLYIMALPVLALIFSTHRFLKNFSLKEV